MQFTVFLPRRRKNGKLVTSRLYTGRYLLDGDIKSTEIRLKVADKQVAEHKLREIVRDIERERAGLISPKPQRDAAKRLLVEHLADFIRTRDKIGRDAKYVRLVERQLECLFSKCQWTLLRDITPDSFETWRCEQEMSPKTLNEYLGAALAFLNWMTKTGRITANPLRSVDKAETRGAKTKERRPYTLEELKRLIAVSGPRSVVYLTAAYTGGFEPATSSRH